MSNMFTLWCSRMGWPHATQTVQIVGTSAKVTTNYGVFVLWNPPQNALNSGRRIMNICPPETCCFPYGSKDPLLGMHFFGAIWGVKYLLILGSIGFLMLKLHQDRVLLPSMHSWAWCGSWNSTAVIIVSNRLVVFFFWGGGDYDKPNI